MCLVFLGQQDSYAWLALDSWVGLCSLLYNTTASAANLQETKDLQQDQQPEERNQRWAELFRKKDGGGGGKESTTPPTVARTSWS